MAITFYERRRNLGLAGGSLWLVTVGIAYATWALLAVQSNAAIVLLAGIAILGVALILFGVSTTRGVARLPFLAGTATSQAQGRRLMLRFGLIFAAECVAIAIVSVACTRTHHWRLIVPLILIIVGLHFLPLAKLFGVPRYNVTGVLFCVIPIVTMLSVPAHAHIGQTVGWIAIPTVGCALVSLATAWAGLNEVRRFVVKVKKLPMEN